MPMLEPVTHINAGVLDIGCYEAGVRGGPVVILRHGWPYDIHSYVDVIALMDSLDIPRAVWELASSTG
jgi:hypothetical protein